MTTLSITETAARLGVTPRHARHLAATGAIPGAVHTNPGNPRRGEWRVPPAGLDAYLAAARARPVAPGRPPRAAKREAET